MIQVSEIVTSVSRDAGGLFYSVKSLVQAIASENSVELEVLGLNDKFTSEDRPQWSPIHPRTFSVQGPRAYGYSRNLRQAVMESNSEILHSHGIWMYPSKVVLQWWKKNRKPYLISPHGMLDPWALKNSAWKKALVNVLFQREHLERAACLHSLGASETQSMRALGLKQPICQIPNGVDLPKPGLASEAPWAKQLKPSDRVLFYLGRLHPKKGLTALVKAFCRVQKSGNSSAKDWYLAIAGWDQGGHEESLKKIAQAEGMDERILFTGPLFNQEKSNAFSGSTAFVLPSYSEGLPVAVLEAWSHSLPVLMTPECNLPEGFAKGAALQISTDLDSLTRSLESFFQGDPAEHRAMGSKGRALVEESFSWAQIAKNMTAVYRWLQEGGTPPSCVIL
jgi:glycosyltransferase involved in cell wall biosynthesis